MDGIVEKIGVPGLWILFVALCVVLFVYGIAQTFWGYKRRVFFRILPGLFAGLLISVATGFLILMHGRRGGVIRSLMDVTHGGILDFVAEIVKAAVTDNKAFGQGLDIASDFLNTVGATDITDVVDTVKTMVIVGVLFSIVCAVVNAAREKIGVALELFAYGYALVAVLCLSAEQSSLLSVVLAIVVGALLGALGYRISRMWIIITTSLVGELILYLIFRTVGIGLMGMAVLVIVVGARLGALGHRMSRTRIIIISSIIISSNIIMASLRAMPVPVPYIGTITQILLSLLGILLAILQVILQVILPIIVGIDVQLKATAIPADKTATQPVAVTAGSAAPSEQAASSPAQSKAARTAKGTSPAGGQSFCAKCGKPLEPGVKFCGKCGQPTRSEEDTAKPV